MKRKQIAWLLAAVICCCNMQANAEALRSEAPQIEAREVPAQSPAAIDKARAERYYQMGLAALQKRNDIQALKAFREAIRADRTDARFYLERGKVFQKRGDYEGGNCAHIRRVLPSESMWYAALPDARQEYEEIRARIFSKYAESLKASKQFYSAALKNYQRALALLGEGKPAAEIFRRRGAIYGALAAHDAAILQFEQEDKEFLQYLALLEPEKQAERDRWKRQDEVLLAKATAGVAARFVKALSHYDEVLRCNPDDAEAYAGRGKVYYERGRYQLFMAGAPSGCWADRYMRRLPRVDMTQFDCGDYRQALADYKRALAMQPDEGRIWFTIGDIHKHMYDDARALTAYSQAARQPELRRDALRARARVFAALRQPEESKTPGLPYNVFLEEEAGPMTYYTYLYHLSGVFRNNVEEIREWTEKLAAEPKNGTFYEQRADVWAREWKFEAAIRDYNQAENYGVKTGALYWKRGESQRKLDEQKRDAAKHGKKRAAVPELADYARAEALGYPNDATEEEAVQFYLTRARLRWSLQQYEAAAKDFTQALRRQEKNGLAYFERSECHQKVGLYHLAAADLYQILLHCPDDTVWYSSEKNAIRAYWELAGLYANDLHDDAKALEACNALLRLSPKDDDTRLRRALLLDRMGEEAKAAEDFRLLQKKESAELRERIPEKYRLPQETTQQEKQSPKE